MSVHKPLSSAPLVASRQWDLSCFSRLFHIIVVSLLFSLNFLYLLDFSSSHSLPLLGPGRVTASAFSSLAEWEFLLTEIRRCVFLGLLSILKEIKSRSTIAIGKIENQKCSHLGLTKVFALILAEILTSDLVFPLFPFKTWLNY